MQINKIHNIDVFKGIELLENNSIDSVITSPPYWALRDYGHKNQIGLEKTYNEYLQKLVSVFVKLKPKLKKTATIFVNIADTYSGSQNGYGAKDLNEKYPTSKQKSLSAKTDVAKKSQIGIPERFKILMIDNGFICRNTIIWHKTNPKPESVKDRFSNDFEYLYFFTIASDYYFKQKFLPFKDSTIERAKSIANSQKASTGQYGFTTDKMNKHYEKIANGDYKGRNMRAVWDIPTQSLRESHFAVFPEKLIETPIQTGSPIQGLILDPFIGSGTTAKVCIENNRNFIGFELNKDYVQIAENRIKNVIPSKLDGFTSKVDVILKLKAKAKLKLLEL